MKRSVKLFSILAALTAAVVFLLALSSGADPVPVGEIAPASVTDGNGSENRGKPHAGFPEGAERRIDFDFDASFRQQLTEREMRDQVLDWLLYTAVADAGLSAAEVNEALFDLAPVRHGYLGPVSSFEYGVTRARYVGDGRVLVVLPVVKAAERLDLLAHVADEQRKNLAELPGELVPFEYALDPGLGAATLTRRPAVPASSLFTEESGYYETPVAALDDLTRFLGRIDDVTYVRRADDHLVLGGRKLQSRPYRGVDVEDVAALWQSEAAITQQQREWEALLAELPAWLREAGGGVPVVSESGFSLDPAFNFEGFAQDFPELGERFNDLVSDGVVEGDPLDLEQLTVDLAAGDLSFIADLEGRLISNESPAVLAWVQSLYSLSKEHQYQAARYDGELQGTKVGMNLFYTDLLAKLWALDKSFPGKSVPGFKPRTAVAVSPTFRKEVVQHNKTRVWFGPRASGFQEQRLSLIFGHNITRIYSASAEAGQSGEEGEPSAASEAFISWWDNHYDEVARFEPEYERLNEIIKWSGVVSWLYHHESEQLLAFAGEVEVDPSNWFPDWAKRNRELRFRDWEQIAFYPLGFAGTETEAMDLVESEYFSWFDRQNTDTRTRGGVDLMGRGKFSDRRPVPVSVSPFTRRAGRTYEDSAPGVMRTFEGRSFKLEKMRPGLARTVVTPREGAFLRNRFGEVPRRNFEQSVVETGEGMWFEARIGNDAFGSLPVTRTANGFRTGWRGREADHGFSLARRLSRAEDMDAALAKDPQVDIYLPLKNGDYAVRIQGSERWLHLRTEAEPTVDLPARFQARVSDPESGLRNLLLARIDRLPLEQSLEAGDWIVFSSTGPSRHSPLRLAPIRGPPEGWKAVELLDGNARRAVHVDPRTGAVATRWGDLPPGVRQAPEGLGRRLVAAAGGGNGGPLRVDGAGFGDGGGGGEFVRAFGGGDFRRAAWAYAEKPDQAKEAWRHTLSQEVETSRRLAKNGEIASALARLDAAIDRYGSAPEITLQKALLEIDRGRIADAAETLKNSGEALTLDRFEELPRWLGRGEPAQRRSGVRAIKLTQARDAAAREGRPRGALVPFFDGRGVDFSYTSTQAPSGRVVPVGETGAVLRANREQVYVQDVLAVESPAAFERSLPELISTGRAFIVELPAGEVGHYRPAAVFTPPGERFTPPSPPPPSVPGGFGGGGSSRPSAGSSPSGAPLCRPCLRFHALVVDDDDEEDEGKIYRRLAEPPPVTPLYLVAAAPPATGEAGDAPAGR